MRCGAKNAKGRPCQAFALGGSKPARCAAHAIKGRMSALGRLGGKQRMRQVDRKPPGPPAPQPGCKAEVDAEIWRLCTRVESGELAARDANVLLAGLRALRETVPDGPSADTQFFGLFERVLVLDAGMVGETAEGLRVPFTDAQVKAYERAMLADGPAEIRVIRNGQVVGQETEVVFEIDPPPEDVEEAERGQWRGPRALPELVIERRTRSDPVN